MEQILVDVQDVRALGIPVRQVLKWAVDPYKDARHIPGNASPRRKKTVDWKFTEFGYRERFILRNVIDNTHIEVECKNCGNVFTRETSCLNASKEHNIECRKCGIRADGAYGHPCSENKRGMDESVVVEYYKQNHSATQTAIKFGMNLRRVRRIIDDAGVARDGQATIVMDDYPDVVTGDPWLDEKFVCSECGRMFTRQQYMIAMKRKNRVIKPPKYCSSACSSKVNERSKRYRRRQREVAAKGDIISLGDLIERDKGICQICKEKVDMGDGFFDENRKFHIGPNYPTVDHIKPISKGGKTVWSNVQLAHLRCNSGKCDRVE